MPGREGTQGTRRAGMMHDRQRRSPVEGDWEPNEPLFRA